MLMPAFAPTPSWGLNVWIEFVEERELMLVQVYWRRMTLEMRSPMQLPQSPLPVYPLARRVI
jgi:hypothetical protein